MLDNYILGFPKAHDRLYCNSMGNVYPIDVTFLGKATEGISQPDHVSFELDGKTVTGFQKLDENQFNDNDIEYILALIGNALGIPVASVLRIYKDIKCSIPHSIISISVSQKSCEQFICFREMRDELFWDLQEETIPLSSWIRAWINIRKPKNNNPPDVWDVKAVSNEDYEACLQFPFEIAKLWSQKHGLNLEDYEDSILKMVMFDLLVGQADRTPSNYGLLVNYQCNIAKLAPLFDNSTLRKPYMNDNQNGFNHMLVEKTKFATTVYRKWGDSFTGMVGCFNDKEAEIIDILNKSSDFIPEHKQTFLKNRIIESMSIFRQIINS